MAREAYLCHLAVEVSFTSVKKYDPAAVQSRTMVLHRSRFLGYTDPLSNKRVNKILAVGAQQDGKGTKGGKITGRRRAGTHLATFWLLCYSHPTDGIVLLHRNALRSAFCKAKHLKIINLTIA